MPLKFDSTACEKVLVAALTLALFAIAQRFVDEARNGFLTGEAKESLKDPDPEEIKSVANTIAIIVTGGAYVAMDNYGKGSLMDKDNPALDAYANSSLWNPLRPDYFIRGRPPGTYQNIFGDMTETSGKRAGKIIERETGPFAPIPPSHALEKAARWLANGEVQHIIKTTIEEFNFSQFMVEL
jgi:hypothetical protein